VEVCAPILTQDTRLQDFIGWDGELPVVERRPYRYVYFLKTPTRALNTKQIFYQNALGFDNPHWLMGQQYFDTEKIHDAMKNIGASSIEKFLGINL